MAANHIGRSVFALSGFAFSIAASSAFAAGDHHVPDGPGVKSVESDFEFQLTESDLSGGDSAFDPNDRRWDGNDSLPLDQFDPSYGTLNKVKFSIGMTIEGAIEISIDPVLLSLDESSSYSDGYPELTFFGAGAAGPLSDEIDFGEYEVGVDGFFEDDGLFINESGTGFDMTDESGLLGFFVGDDVVGVDLLASVFADYDSGEFGTSGGNGLTASGWVRLTYEFDPNDTPESVVPTPTAACLGLGMLVALTVRRRR
ncbi:MAG: choice-of-anchor E domain-containing protein [Planctomycetota bacterium]